MTFVFLVSYFLYWNGISTLLFASTILLQAIPGMTTVFIGLSVVLAFIFAGSSSMIWLFLQRKFPKIFPHKIIIVSSVIASLFLPIWTVFGLTTVVEGFLSSMYFGLLLGGILSSVRASFSEMIPAGSESEFWTIFSLVGQASSFLGPLVVVFVNEAACSLRIASFSVLGFCVLGKNGCVLV